MYSCKQLTCESENQLSLHGVRKLLVTLGLSTTFALMLPTSTVGAQLKDCFAVYREANQSQQTANQECCTGVFDDSKQNSQGWVWHEGLNLYVDKSKCDYSALKKTLLERLKDKDPESKPVQNKSDKLSNKIRGQDKKSAKPAEVDVSTKFNFENNKIIQQAGNFAGKNLAGLEYQYGDASGANFEGANLRNANFSGTTLTNANFKNAQLHGAVFDFAYLKNATFAGAELSGASLKGAVLRGASFIGARVTAAQLSVAIWVGAILDATLEKGIKDLDKGMDKTLKDN